MNKEETKFEGESINLDDLLGSNTPFLDDDLEIVEKPTVEEETEEKEAVEEDNTPPVEEEQETVKDKEDEVEIQKTLDKNTGVSSKVKTLLELGLLEDVIISRSDEDEDGTPISEIEDLTDDELKEVIEAQKTQKDSETKEKYLDKEGLKPHHIKVIEALKNGTSIKEVLGDDPDTQMKRPFEGLDLTKAEAKKSVLYTYYTGSRGLSQKDAVKLIESREEDGELDGEADKIYDAYQKAYDTHWEGIAEKSKEKKEQEQKILLERKKSLNKIFKDTNIRESVYRKVVDSVSQKNDNNEEKIFDTLRDILKNPEENYEILLHLTDKESFNKINKINNSKEGTKRVIKLVNDSKSKAKSDIKKESNEQGAIWERAIEF